jgi:glycosyltransferase involved in cell wall biosynthesis
MNIGVNGWFYSAPYTGIGQYTVNLVKELSALATGKHIITVFINSNGRSTTLPVLPNVEYHTIDKKNRANDIVDVLEFEYLLKIASNKLKIDMLHTPYLCSPVLHGNSFKHIVTVHDVIPMVLRKYRGSYFRQFYLWCAERQINRADLIITDSVHSQTDIHKYLGIDRDRIKVITIAADPVFKKRIDENKMHEIKEKYSLPNEYIFYIGGFDFRKNVKILLEAYAEARKNGICELLVLGGKFSPSVKQLMRGLVENVVEIANNLNIQDCIRILGPIPQDDLPYIYKMARLFVYPSLYEGFGLPPLEAMICGTPVLASDCSSIPEIIDREDLLFDPDDPHTLSKKMCLLLADQELRCSTSEWGIKRAGAFSWIDTAKQTMQMYEHVVNITAL